MVSEQVHSFCVGGNLDTLAGASPPIAWYPWFQLGIIYLTLPISLSEDVFVVLSVSDVLVDYVGRYFDIRRASLGWVAVVFCTAVLGYDKGVVIK